MIILLGLYSTIMQVALLDIKLAAQLAMIVLQHQKFQKTYNCKK